MKTYDFIVVGAGIIGLAIARKLREKYPSQTILVIEKEQKPGLHATGRNSGVLHSGIYYSPGSMKARICLRGAQLMRDFAGERNIPYAKNGKVIVAVCQHDLPIINKLMDNAKASGIRAEKLTADEIQKIEPYCRPYKTGIYCPDTTVIDGKAVASRLYEILSADAVEFLFGHKAVAAGAEQNMVTAGKERFGFGHFFNCAGAYADELARGFGVGRDYRLVPFKGIYYKLAPDSAQMTQGSIYPVPDIRFPFLGVHFTRAISGDVYVGPTAIPALGRENYHLVKDIDPADIFSIGTRLAGMYIHGPQGFRLLVNREVKKYFKRNFVKEARRLVPSITSSSLIRSSKVGIRPQLVDTRDNTLVMDYLLEKTERSTHVLNAISPAFTSAFEFANHVVKNS